MWLVLLKQDFIGLNQRLDKTLAICTMILVHQVYKRQTGQMDTR